tara:strand:- start:129 stop:428 length:300 start_codon:yes stop_codon:yes gene_type:complete
MGLESFINFLEQVVRHNEEILAIKEKLGVYYVVTGQPKSWTYAIQMVTEQGISDVHVWQDGKEREEWGHIIKKKIYASRVLDWWLDSNQIHIDSGEITA